MMTLLWFLMFGASPSDTAALQRTASAYFATADVAGEHLTAARAAAAFYQVEADDLLAIAWHESRYTPGVVTHEPGGRVSCGVMTPKPKARCEAWELELAGGYLAGAAHLREWYDVCRQNRACALNGYAGGANDGQVRGHKTWEVFAWRAAWIARERSRPRPSS